MLQLVNQKPDTCGCIFGYTYDDAVDGDQRASTHTIRIFFSRGPEMMHLNEANDEVLFNQIQGEQNTHSFVKALAKTLLPSLEDEDYTWSFDEKRMLHVSFRGMSDALKNQLRGNLKYEGEPGVVVWDMTDKVVIE